MEERRFQNREIKEMFSSHNREEIIRHEAQMEKLSSIETQTKLTNGRVTKLEWWRQWATGGMGIIVILVVPIFTWMLYRLATIDDMIKTDVSQALLPYSKP